eukprot:comp12154_c0_seq1/m.6905 comp12154_c0_seq1/g.6905  ORF comp12154_c0_seq1/g.6905 comp12154_c0_seq1/m.6905 type:complete len:365 (-) comp12154_c0_seq1:299-1393(-)
MASSLDKGVRLHQEKLAEAYRHREEELEKWRGYLRDYEALERRLATLPDKTKHEIMVPLGPLAFMPGQIVHTNEILVLLGDNIFAERSAKQAVGIIKRRQEFVKGNINAVEKLLNDLGTRAEYAQHEVWGGAKDEEGNDIIEINEPATEEEERAWQERNVYKPWVSKPSKVSNKGSETKVKKETEEEKAQFKAFMESLEKLERLEREQGEGYEQEEEEDVEDVEEETGESEENDDEEEEEEQEEDEVEEDVEDVKVEVEEVEDIDIVQERNMTKEIETSAKDVITTGPTLSKFKQQREQQRAEAQRKQEEERYRVPEKPAAFTGGVVERDFGRGEGVGKVPDEQQKSAPERVSRFKAAMKGGKH